MKEMLIAYIFGISIFTLAVFGIDKRKARKHQNRISENTLLILTFFGGTIGSIVGMIVFNHKISKRSFLFKIFFVIALQILLICLIYNHQNIF
ncbi:DUF1294 domain-containing protein [Kaistella jeonii]|uniref:DUF1294 domain-containing protein n=1 Tax=Kaistella jeonii TaxID=266749 RepID=A0A0C1FPI7_9FLAO|nr:DUF1294 domain-containing protein [Kaistella jeonii]KIA89784.1 hypothetical protein OA86_03935 [Kaistella jeonii]SFB86401.1 Uncharacterized membrane protein YsdA, DUF1294 family [Kaistella jeonii]VEI96015.1 Protein of uncharacterised function (DUF1294) [Kaistella jeonii]